MMFLGKLSYRVWCCIVGQALVVLLLQPTCAVTQLPRLLNLPSPGIQFLLAEEVKFVMRKHDQNPRASGSLPQ